MPTVLYAEDDRAIRTSLTTAIELEGHSVVAFADGQAADEWLLEGNVADLIILGGLHQLPPSNVGGGRRVSLSPHRSRSWLLASRLGVKLAARIAATMALLVAFTAAAVAAAGIGVTRDRLNAEIDASIAVVASPVTARLSEAALASGAIKGRRVSEVVVDGERSRVVTVGIETFGAVQIAR